MKLNKKVIINSIIEILEQELKMLFYIVLVCLDVRNSSIIFCIMERAFGINYQLKKERLLVTLNLKMYKKLRVSPRII